MSDAVGRRDALASTILGATGNYTTALYITNVALIVGLLLVALLRWRVRRIRQVQGAPTTSPLD